MSKIRSFFSDKDNLIWIALISAVVYWFATAEPDNEYIALKEELPKHSVYDPSTRQFVNCQEWVDYFIRGWNDLKKDVMRGCVEGRLHLREDLTYYVLDERGNVVLNIPPR